MRSLKILAVDIAILAIWSFGVGPRLIYLGPAPIILMSVGIGLLTSVVSFKVKNYLDEKDREFGRYERKLLREIEDIMEEQKSGN